MEPQSPLSNPSPEMGVNRASEAQQQPRGNEAVLQQPEQAPQAAEQHEVAPQAPTGAPAPVVTPLPQMPTLPPPQQPSEPAQQQQAAGQTPLVASDDDVIEKEWVDKAKKIVQQTKDDPYAQEKEVSKLQADYLKKRYGKELKLSE